MLRYEATSAVWDNRPWLGTIHVPPCDRYCEGQVEDLIQAGNHALA
jgi:hypothetical protein